jgi:hypothetical protein
LELQQSRRHSDQLSATLDYGDVKATVEVDDSIFGFRGLAQLFVEIAMDWAGWEGVKSWSSNGYLGQLAFDCSHNRVNAIRLSVTLRPNPWPAEWKLSADLAVVPGAAEALRKDVAELVDSLPEPEL